MFWRSSWCILGLVLVQTRHHAAMTRNVGVIKQLPPLPSWGTQQPAALHPQSECDHLTNQKKHSIYQSESLETCHDPKYKTYSSPKQSKEIRNSFHLAHHESKMVFIWMFLAVIWTPEARRRREKQQSHDNGSHDVWPIRDPRYCNWPITDKYGSHEIWGWVEMCSQS